MTALSGCGMGRAAKDFGGNVLSVGGLFGGEKPAFEVSAARLVDRTDEGISLEFTLSGFNSSDKPLPLRNVDYTLSVDGKTVFHGSRAAEHTLPVGGTQDILLPAVVPLDALGSGSPRYVLSGLIEYSKPGELADVLFDSKIMRPKIGFRDQGTLDLGEPSSTAMRSDTP